MITKPENALHKAELYRLLIKIFDNCKLLESIYFKGGTCAAMLGFLDRFSVDLDFDLNANADKAVLRKELHKIFQTLNLEIKDQSKKALQFFLKYQSLNSQRNTIKLDIIDNLIKANKYKAQYLPEIDRTALCQTIETMFANKLVAVIDRYEKTKAIAGRDIYDIHYFFTHAHAYDKAVIQERRKIKSVDYLKNLHKFIKNKISNKHIDQDLNALLPYKKFKLIRTTLKIETLMLIQDEIKKLTS